MNNDHVTGFVAGVACTAFAYYWYHNNKERIDEFLKAQELGLQGPLGSLNYPGPAAEPRDPSPSLEELMREKERLEDQIAELSSKTEKV